MDKENTLKIQDKEIKLDKLKGLKENYTEFFIFLEKNTIWDRSYSKGYEVTLIDSLGNTLLDVMQSYYLKHMAKSKNNRLQNKIVSLDYYGTYYIIRKKLNQKEFSIISKETSNNDNFYHINFEKILGFIENEIIEL